MPTIVGVIIIEHVKKKELFKHKIVKEDLEDPEFMEAYEKVLNKGEKLLEEEHQIKMFQDGRPITIKVGGETGRPIITEGEPRLPELLCFKIIFGPMYKQIKQIAKLIGKDKIDVVTDFIRQTLIETSMRESGLIPPPEVVDLNNLEKWEKKRGKKTENNLKT